MKANVRCLILAGVSLLLLRVPPLSRRTESAPWSAVVGGLTLSEHLFGWDAGIDQRLFQEAPGAPATVSPGRMGPPASSCLLLAGVALLLLHRRRATRVAQACGGVVILIALQAIVGYAYGATQLFEVAAYTGIALHTAITFLVLGFGLVAVRWDGNHGPAEQPCPAG
jgi:hypothetical protein